MMEPFLLPIPEDRRMWRDDLDIKIQVVRDLAEEFADALVPHGRHFRCRRMQTGEIFLDSRRSASRRARTCSHCRKLD